MATVKIELVSCLICDAEYSNELIYGHVSQHHFGYRRYACPKCGLSGCYEDYVVHHMMQEGHGFRVYDNCIKRPNLNRLVDLVVEKCRCATAVGSAGGGAIDLDGILALFAASAQPQVQQPQSNAVTSSDVASNSNHLSSSSAPAAPSLAIQGCVSLAQEGAPGSTPAQSNSTSDFSAPAAVPPNPSENMLLPLAVAVPILPGKLPTPSGNFLTPAAVPQNPEIPLIAAAPSSQSSENVVEPSPPQSSAEGEPALVEAPIISQSAEMQESAAKSLLHERESLVPAARSSFVSPEKAKMSFPICSGNAEAILSSSQIKSANLELVLKSVAAAAISRSLGKSSPVSAALTNSLAPANLGSDIDTSAKDHVTSAGLEENTGLMCRNFVMETSAKDHVTSPDLKESAGVTCQDIVMKTRAKDHMTSSESMENTDLARQNAVVETSAKDQVTSPNLTENTGLTRQNDVIEASAKDHVSSPDLKENTGLAHQNVVIQTSAKDHMTSPDLKESAGVTCQDIVMKTRAKDHMTSSESMENTDLPSQNAVVETSAKDQVTSPNLTENTGLTRQNDVMEASAKDHVSSPDLKENTGLAHQNVVIQTSAKDHMTSLDLKENSGLMKRQNVVMEASAKEEHVTSPDLKENTGLSPQDTISTSVDLSVCSAAIEDIPADGSSNGVVRNSVNQDADLAETKGSEANCHTLWKLIQQKASSVLSSPVKAANFPETPVLSENKAAACDAQDEIAESSKSSRKRRKEMEREDRKKFCDDLIILDAAVIEQHEEIKSDESEDVSAELQHEVLDEVLGVPSEEGELTDEDEEGECDTEDSGFEKQPAPSDQTDKKVVVMRDRRLSGDIDDRLLKLKPHDLLLEARGLDHVTLRELARPDWPSGSRCFPKKPATANRQRPVGPKRLRLPRNGNADSRDSRRVALNRPNGSRQSANGSRQSANGSGHNGNAKSSSPNKGRNTGFQQSIDFEHDRVQPPRHEHFDAGRNMPGSSRGRQKIERKTASGEFRQQPSPEEAYYYRRESGNRSNSSTASVSKSPEKKPVPLMSKAFSPTISAHRPATRDNSPFPVSRDPQRWILPIGYASSTPRCSNTIDRLAEMLRPEPAWSGEGVRGSAQRAPIGQSSSRDQRPPAAVGPSAIPGIRPELLRRRF